MKPNFRISKDTLPSADEGKAWELVLASIFDGPSVPEKELLKAMTSGQRVLYRLNQFHTEVLNGGIHQYLCNSAGKNAEETMAALRLIRARPYIKLLEGVFAKFPNCCVPKSRLARQKVLASISEELTSELFDSPYYDLQKDTKRKLDAFIESYVREHAEDFFLHDGEPVPVDPDRDPTQWLLDYRVSRQVGENAKGQELHWRLLEGVLWNHLRGSRDIGRREDFLARLTPGQRALIAFEYFHRDPDPTPGLCGHLMCSGDLLNELVAGYELIGAKAYRDLMMDLLSKLPKSVGSKQFKERYDAFRMTVTPYDKQFAIDDQFENQIKLLCANPTSSLRCLADYYISAHPEEFYKD